MATVTAAGCEMPALERHRAYSGGDVAAAIGRARALAESSLVDFRHKQLRFDVCALSNEVISLRRLVGELTEQLAAVRASDA